MVILVEEGPLVICLGGGGELISISGENLKERSEYMSKEPEKQGEREARRVMKDRKLKNWQDMVHLPSGLTVMFAVVDVALTRVMAEILRWFCSRT